MKTFVMLGAAGAYLTGCVGIGVEINPLGFGPAMMAWSALTLLWTTCIHVIELNMDRS